MLRMSLTVSSGSSSIVSSTFHTTLIHQLFDVLLILVALMVVWSFLRRAKSSRVIGDGASTRCQECRTQATSTLNPLEGGSCG